MKDQVEVWKPIPGYEGKYEFSNLHNVKSLSRFIKRGNGGFWSKEKILKIFLEEGYYKVGLCLNGKSKSFGIHQLVAMEFLNHTPCGFELVVEHKNQIRTDNRIENLEIITQRKNANKKHIKSSSKYTGVSWHKKNNKWRSAIVIEGKVKHLGYFEIEEEASEYYENALKNHLSGLPIKTKNANFSSKYEGVSLSKAAKKYMARITIKGKQIYLGSFNTELEAHLKYQNELLKISEDMQGRN